MRSKAIGAYCAGANWVFRPRPPPEDELEPRNPRLVRGNVENEAVQV
jgi:hypothetical protein